MQHEININFKCNRKEACIFLLSFWISFLFLAMVNVEVQLRELEESYCNLSQILSESLMLWLANHSYTLSLTIMVSSLAFIIIAIHTNAKERAAQVTLLLIHIFLTFVTETSLLIYPSYDLWGNFTITLANAILILLWRLSAPQVSLAGVKLVFLLLYIYPITSSFLVQQRQIAFSEIFYKLFIFIWLYYAMLHLIAVHSTHSSSLNKTSAQNTLSGSHTQQNQNFKDTSVEPKMSLNIFNSPVPNSYPVNENINIDIHNESNLNITNTRLVREIPFAKFSMVQNNKLSFNDSILEDKDDQSSKLQGFSQSQLKPEIKQYASDKDLTGLEAISLHPDDNFVEKFLPTQQMHDQQNSAILLISQDFNVCTSSCSYQEAKNYLVQFQADFIDNYFQLVLKKGQQETQDIKEVLFHRDFCSLLAVDGERSSQSNFEQRKIVPLFKCEEDCPEMIIFEVNEKQKLKQHYSDSLFNRQYKIAHLQDQSCAQGIQLLIICTKVAQKNQNLSWPNILNEQEKSFKESLNESNRRLRESQIFSTLAEPEKEFKTYKKRILACLSHELRTPLNSIYFAFRSVMDEIELPQQMKELLFLGFKNTELLRIILNTLIDYSQMDIEECEISFSTFSVDNLLQNCVDIYSGVCEMKKLSISYDFDPKYPTSINSDQERLMQIIVNLLSYCVRQTSFGSIQISLQKDLPPSECQTPIFINNQTSFKDEYLYQRSGKISDHSDNMRNKNIPNQSSMYTSEQNSNNLQIQIIITVRGGIVGGEQLKTLKKSIAQGVASSNHNAARGRRSRSMLQSEDYLTEKERALPLSPIFCAEMCKCLGSGKALEVHSDEKNFMQFRFVIVNQHSTSSGLKQTQGTNNELRFEPILLRQIASLHYSSGESDLVSGFNSNKNSEFERQNNKQLQHKDSKRRSKGSVFEQPNQVQKQKLQSRISCQAYTENLINNIQSDVSVKKKMTKHNSLLEQKQLQQVYQKNVAGLQIIDQDGADKEHNVSEYFLTNNISNCLPKRKNSLQAIGNQQTINIENSQNYYPEQDKIYQNPKELNKQQNLSIIEQDQQKQSSNFAAATLNNSQLEKNNLDSLENFNDFRNSVQIQTLAMRDQISPQYRKSSYPYHMSIKSSKELNQAQHGSLDSSQKNQKMIKVSKEQTNSNILTFPSNKSLPQQHDSSARAQNSLNNHQDRQFSFENIMLQEQISVIIAEKNKESVQEKMESLNKQTVVFDRRKNFLNSPRQRNNSYPLENILKLSQDFLFQEQDRSQTQQQILKKEYQENQLPKDTVGIQFIQSDMAIEEEFKE